MSWVHLSDRICLFFVPFPFFFTLFLCQRLFLSQRFCKGLSEALSVSLPPPLLFSCAQSVKRGPCLLHIRCQILFPGVFLLQDKSDSEALISLVPFLFCCLHRQLSHFQFHSLSFLLLLLPSPRPPTRAPLPPSPTPPLFPSSIPSRIHSQQQLKKKKLNVPC